MSEKLQIPKPNSNATSKREHETERASICVAHVIVMTDISDKEKEQLARMLKQLTELEDKEEDLKRQRKSKSQYISKHKPQIDKTLEYVGQVEIDHFVFKLGKKDWIKEQGARYSCYQSEAFLAEETHNCRYLPGYRKYHGKEGQGRGRKGGGQAEKRALKSMWVRYHMHDTHRRQEKNEKG